MVTKTNLRSPSRRSSSSPRLPPRYALWSDLGLLNGTPPDDGIRQVAEQRAGSRPCRIDRGETIPYRASPSSARITDQGRDERVELAAPVNECPHAVLKRRRLVKKSNRAHNSQYSLTARGSDALTVGGAASETTPTRPDYPDRLERNGIKSNRHFVLSICLVA